MSPLPPRLGALIGFLLLVFFPLVGHAESLTTLRVSTLSAEEANRIALPAPAAPPERPKLPPPVPLYTDLLVSSGQAHLLAATRSGSRELTVLAYHSITDTWADFGKVTLPGEPISLRAAPAGFIIETRGEKEGITALSRVELVMAKRLLSWPDYLAVGLYLVFVMTVGMAFAKEKDKNEFFLGGQKIPWWAAGFSLYATGTSAISFMAIPAKSFATNWQYLMQNFIGFFGSIYLAIVIIPLIRRLNLTSVYNYLELRFHPIVRTTGSMLIIIFKLVARMGVVLYLPALAISSVTGLDEITSILIMGVVTTIYTIVGGMKAVIWTDMAQVIVMFGGALLCIFYVVKGVDGGLGGALKIATSNDKMQLLDFRFDFTVPTFWVFVLVAIAETIAFPRDQIMVQRCLCTPNARDAGRSMWMLNAIILPGSLLFFSIGTALFVFYKAHPERLNPLLKTDSIVPHFIASELPSGVTGLVIAALFAASMSALNSCMHSIATLVSVDFYERFAKKPDSSASLRVAKWAIFFTGLFGTVFALLLTRFSLPSLFDTFLALTGLLGGGLGGTYALGMFTRRANWQGAMIGTIGSILVTLAVKQWTSLNFLLYTSTAIFSCMALGYAASFFFPAQTGSLRGLTIFKEDAAAST
jgi:SSS family solute:Na+ symporter